MIEHTPITTDQLLDSMMRAAVGSYEQSLVAASGGTFSWQPTYKPGPLDGLVQSVKNLLDKDEDFKEALSARLKDDKTLDAIAGALVAKLPQTFLTTERIGSYGGAETTVIAKHFREAFETALAAALKPVLATYVARTISVEDLDRIQITVNVTVNK